MALVGRASRRKRERPLVERVEWTPLYFAIFCLALFDGFLVPFLWMYANKPHWLMYTDAAQRQPMDDYSFVGYFLGLCMATTGLAAAAFVMPRLPRRLEPRPSRPRRQRRKAEAERRRRDEVEPGRTRVR